MPSDMMHTSWYVYGQTSDNTRWANADGSPLEMREQHDSYRDLGTHIEG